MSLTFYYLSGSPFSWRVWLALEHKAVHYDFQLLRAEAGDLKGETYRQLNPHGKAPAIVDEGFALYESVAILEYLEDRYAASGRRIWPADVRRRAVARRMVAEADAYLYPPVRRCVEELLLRKDGAVDELVVQRARESAEQALALFASQVEGPYLLGSDPSGADFAAYPLTAMLARLDMRHPDRSFRALLPPRLKQWQASVEALPYFEKTFPPHWRKG